MMCCSPFSYPLFFSPKHARFVEDHELHDLTVAVTRTKHRLNGAISLLMEALQELKDKGAARRPRRDVEIWGDEIIPNSICILYYIILYIYILYIHRGRNDYRCETQ